MTIWFQRWNDESNNLMEKFADEDAALDEVRRRVRLRGEEAVRVLSLLVLNEASEAGNVAHVVHGDHLVQIARGIAHAGD